VVLEGEVVLAEHNGVSTQRRGLEVEERTLSARRLLGLFLLGAVFLLLLLLVLLVEFLSELAEDLLLLGAASASTAAAATATAGRR